MATFELHHLSLAPRAQPDLFDREPGKAAWIRRAFSKQRTFEHRGNNFHWVPYGVKATDGAVIGVIERQYPIQHYEAPEDGGKPTSSDIWQGAVVTIDPEHHDDGQKLAFERGTKVGQPLAVLSSLVGAINTLPEAPYIITVKAIWDEQSFQTFARRHGNLLRSITFDFVVPNMFDLSGKLDEKLKQVGEDTGAQHVKLTLESPDGVKADAPEVQSGVAYGAKGQATLTATAMDGDRYTSTDKVRTTRVSSLIGQGMALVALVRDKLDEVLGRNDVIPIAPDRDRDGASRN
ncbi:hypothetical protein [Sphingomonas sp. Leaf30]|uniref:hypothetical protein n=1 Tax=Sphingomonas sp. Leaf30 TaxID=1736213 RepID=UPI0012E19254|nr:hypothetical protein [Sphingomonas sp. Leaf30]